VYVFVLARTEPDFSRRRFWPGPVQFVGRHTLAIYAITLAAFEIIVKLFPDLAA
jgi:hypothetical protein